MLSDGVFQTLLGAPGQSDPLTIDGQALLAGRVDALPVAGFVPAIGSSYTILTAQGGITANFLPDSSLGEGFGNLDAAFPFLAPALSYSPTAVTLAIASDVPFAAAGITANESAAGAGADGLALTSPVTAASSPQPMRRLPRSMPCRAKPMPPSNRCCSAILYLRDATMGGCAALADAAHRLIRGIPASAAALPGGDPKRLPPAVWAEGFGGWDHFSGNQCRASQLRRRLPMDRQSPRPGLAHRARGGLRQFQLRCRQPLHLGQRQQL